jgi:sugar-phosphatase
VPATRGWHAGGVTDSRAVLLDVDGTLVDAIAGQRRIWGEWAVRFRLDTASVYEVALRTRPLDTAAEVLPGHDAAAAVALFDELEDADAASGEVLAIAGAAELLAGLEASGDRRWALVTSNAERRVARRFARLGLPLPSVIVDNLATPAGKPAPDPYLLAADRLGVPAGDCLVVEDSPSGVAAGLAAGMTVWCVNRSEPIAGAHRHYATLANAVGDILALVTGDGGARVEEHGFRRLA